MTEQIEQRIAELCAYVENRCPGVRFRISGETFEDEDAYIFVYPPLTWDDERVYELQHEIGQKTLDLLLETGYHIVAYVYERGQQLQEAVRKKKDAIRVLDEAARLNLLPAA